MLASEVGQIGPCGQTGLQPLRGFSLTVRIGKLVYEATPEAVRSGSRGLTKKRTQLRGPHHGSTHYRQNFRRVHPDQPLASSRAWNVSGRVEMERGRRLLATSTDPLRTGSIHSMSTASDIGTRRKKLQRKGESAQVQSATLPRWLRLRTAQSIVEGVAENLIPENHFVFVHGKENGDRVIAICANVKAERNLGREVVKLPKGIDAELVQLPEEKHATWWVGPVADIAKVRELMKAYRKATTRLEDFLYCYDDPTVFDPEADQDEDGSDDEASATADEAGKAVAL